MPLRRSFLVARMVVLLEDAEVRVAAIYDIHGNLPALEAALSAIAGSCADLIVVGGDIAWGPLPRETLERLLTLGGRARFIRGDADRDVLASLAAKPDPDDATAVVSRWCAEELSQEQREFLSLQAESWRSRSTGSGRRSSAMARRGATGMGSQWRPRRRRSCRCLPGSTSAWSSAATPTPSSIGGSVSSESSTPAVSDCSSGSGARTGRC